MKIFFISSTDTNSGKTYVTCQLLDYFAKQGKTALALKPVASGLIHNQGQWINEDIRCLQQHNPEQPYPINGWQFALPVSPHIAAKRAKACLKLHEIADFCLNKDFERFDYLLIEGAGGLMAPLNEQETWLDFLKLTEIPVILVVGMRLGCLNHALLTDWVLKQEQIRTLGWVANCLDPQMLELEENIATLSNKLQSPKMASLSYKGSFSPDVKIERLFAKI